MTEYIVSSASNMDSDQPLRHACDRCHAQKLRCPRSVRPDTENPNQPCSRCLKAGLPCVVSIRGKAGRPAKATKKKIARQSISAPRPSVTSTPERDMVMEMEICRSWQTHQQNQSNQGGLIPNLGTALEEYQQEDKGSSCSGRSASQPPLLDAEPVLTPLHVPNSYDAFSMMDFATPDMELHESEYYIHDASNMSHGFVTDPAESLAASNTPMDSVIDPELHLQPTSAHPASMTDTMANGAGLDEFNQPPASSSLSVKTYSTSASYEKLSNLSGRISTFYRPNMRYDPQTLLKDVVSFCGELIDTTRRTIPQMYCDPSRKYPLSRITCALSTCTTAVAPSDDGESSSMDSSSTYHGHGFRHPDVSFYASDMPDSALVFLLLGCYTQILRLFELSIDSIWAQYPEFSCSTSTVSMAPTLSLGHEQLDETALTGTPIGPLLEASLAVHTVTYLLGRLNNSFNTAKAPFNGEASEPWQTGFLGNNKGQVDCNGEGLLGKAFREITEREQELMKKTQYLQQRINKSH